MLPNDRPMLMGTHGMVVAGHYLAAAAGFEMLRRGGNAVDAAAATGFVLSVVEQQENSPGGEVPMLVYSAQERKTYAISGVGWSPAAFTIDWCREHGIDLIPGDGFLPATVPATVGTWCAALERFGTMRLAEVLEPAIEYAEHGFPAYERLIAEIVGREKHIRSHYPTTCKVYIPEGCIPEVGDIIRNPDLADTFRLLCAAEGKHADREAGIRAACAEFYTGEPAKRMVEFSRTTPVIDGSGEEHTGLFTLEDFAGWKAMVEEPVSVEFEGMVVNKCSSWTQGPVFTQMLALLKGFDLRKLGHNTPEYLHTWIECAKLAFADREAYYGDPAVDDVPFDVLLSERYNAERGKLVGERASMELRPGDIGNGIPDWGNFDVRADNRRAMGLPSLEEPGGESHANDTTQLDVMDSQGNAVAATPSGGWITSSPMVPGVGFPLGTRGQMFYLNPARPNALAGHKRPRATLTPTIATRDGEVELAFGMQGGDIQDQITLQFFLNHVVFGMNVQEALDAPTVMTYHFPGSVFPRGAEIGSAILENRFDDAVKDAMRERGHVVRCFGQPQARYKMLAIRRDRERGILQGGVCSTGEHAYGMGW